MLEGLAHGWHTISLKAWDLQNNSSEEIIDFYVDDAAGILLSEVVNYPNPFVESTTFGFVHNKNGSALEIEVKIYDINGKYIGSLVEEVNVSAGGVAPITWNGRDQHGNEVPAGFYTYHIIVSDLYGNTTIQRQKMIKMNK
jgi:flagellar hook assembly protein FlgD